MNRRQFGLVLGSLGLNVALPVRISSGQTRCVAFFNSVGARIFHSFVDIGSGEMTPLGSILLESTVQYAWFHPRTSILYAAIGNASTNRDDGNLLCAISIGQDGNLSLVGKPAILEKRPVHVSLDHKGKFAIVSFTVQPCMTVIRINPDGTLGEAVIQSQIGSYGFYPHQARMLPNGKSIALVCRGSDARSEQEEEPGSLLQFAFNNGRLNLTNVLKEGDHGFGYGPRHLDFHPTRPWVYVAVERQNQIHMHSISNRGLIQRAKFISQTTKVAAFGASQAAGAIHVHPRGHVVYVSNRSTRPTDLHQRPEPPLGENSIAVFKIDPLSGEPKLLQTASVPGISPRSFSIDPTGTLLIVATQLNSLRAKEEKNSTALGDLHFFRIADDGTLDLFGSQRVSPSLDERQMWCTFDVRR